MRVQLIKCFCKNGVETLILQIIAYSLASHYYGQVSYFSFLSFGLMWFYTDFYAEARTILGPIRNKCLRRIGALYSIGLAFIVGSLAALSYVVLAIYSKHVVDYRVLGFIFILSSISPILEIIRHRGEISRGFFLVLLGTSKRKITS
jgi:hypothetical protein